MKKTLEKITNYIIYLVQPETIMLFGSLAQGKNNIYSDVDLLVISETSANKNVLSKQIQSFAKELSVDADILIRSKTEVDDACSNPHSFLEGVIKNSKIIYKKYA